MLEKTADGENGFQGAKTVLVSSTVSPAAIARRALNANAVAPGRHPTTQLSGSCPAAIKTRDASKMGCRLEATRIVPSGSDALERPLRLTLCKMIRIVPALPRLAERGKLVNHS